MRKNLSRLFLTIVLIIACFARPIIRTETEVLSSLERVRITSFSALGKVSYYGSQGFEETDFRCSIKGEFFRFTLTGPLGMPVGEVIGFGDSLYLYDGVNGLLTITRPDKSLKEITGAEVVPSELKNSLLGDLPDFRYLKGFKQERGKVILEFPSGWYYFNSRNLALLRIEQQNQTVEFSNFISTSTGPRPSFIRIVQGEERTEIIIHEQAVNPVLDDEVFRFQIPEGVEIQDLR